MFRPHTASQLASAHAHKLAHAVRLSGTQRTLPVICVSLRPPSRDLPPVTSLSRPLSRDLPPVTSERPPSRDLPRTTSVAQPLFCDIPLATSLPRPRSCDLFLATSLPLPPSDLRLATSLAQPPSRDLRSATSFSRPPRCAAVGRTRAPFSSASRRPRTFATTKAAPAPRCSDRPRRQAPAVPTPPSPPLALVARSPPHLYLIRTTPSPRPRPPPCDLPSSPRCRLTLLPPTSASPAALTCYLSAATCGPASPCFL